jgi:glycine cleavage system regulatory protein
MEARNSRPAANLTETITGSKPAASITFITSDAATSRPMNSGTRSFAGPSSVNIEEFSSSIEGAPFSGAEMFRASAQLGMPDDLASDDLRKTLERLAAEIMVDLTVTAGDA